MGGRKGLLDAGVAPLVAKSQASRKIELYRLGRIDEKPAWSQSNKYRKPMRASLVVRFLSTIALVRVPAPSLLGTLPIER